MPNYPNLTSGSTTLTRISHRPVRVLRFSNGSTQRWKVAKQLEAFQVNHSGISKVDMLAVKAFVAARRGPFGTFDFAFGGETYHNCSLDSQSWRAIENNFGGYDATVSFSQSK